MQISAQSLTILLTEMRRTLIRFPLSLVSAFIAAQILWYSVYDPGADLNFAAFTAMLGISLLTAISLYFERPHAKLAKFKYLGLFLGAAALALFYLKNENRTSDAFFMLCVQVALATHLFFAVCGFARANELNGFWQFNRIVFIRFLTSVLYAVILYAGLAIAGSAIHYLLNFDLGNKIYAQLFIFCMVIFQTWHFLAGIPTHLASLETVQDYPRELKVLTQYILISLVSLYMVILYLYMIRICILGALPKGYVGWMVSILSVAGIFNLLLLYPIRNKAENLWVKTYSKWFYILILPLVGMLFVGLFKRINDYGITEPRYFLFILAVWLVAIAIYFILSRVKNIKVIPLSLLVLTVLTAFGPWSAHQVSLASQTKRFDKLLDKYQVDRKNPLVNTKIQISDEDAREMKEIMAYLIDSRETKEKSAEGRVYSKHEKATTALNEMGLMKVDREDSNELSYMQYSSDWQSVAIDIKGYDLVIPLSATKYDLQNQIISYRSDRIKDSFSIKEFSKNLLEKYDYEKKDGIFLEDMSFEVDGETSKAKIVFYSIDFTRQNDGLRPSGINGLLLLKLK